MYSESENSESQCVLNQKVLLIDLENCPSQIRLLQDDLATFSQVVICYAQNSSKIPLDWLGNLAAAIHDNKLKIIKMEIGGKNAADFGICFFAGMLMQSLSRETHFVIVSNDTDLDHVVRLLISQGRTAERVGKAKEEKELQSCQSDILPHLKLYCGHLVTYSKNRPTKEATLLNSIKSKFNNSPTTADSIFKSLLSQSIVKVANGKITYDEKKIKALADA